MSNTTVGGMTVQPSMLELIMFIKGSTIRKPNGFRNMLINTNAFAVGEEALRVILSSGVGRYSEPVTAAAAVCLAEHLLNRGVFKMPYLPTNRSVNLSFKVGKSTDYSRTRHYPWGVGERTETLTGFFGPFLDIMGFYSGDLQGSSDFTFLRASLGRIFMEALDTFLTECSDDEILLYHDFVYHRCSHTGLSYSFDANNPYVGTYTLNISSDLRARVLNPYSVLGLLKNLRKNHYNASMDWVRMKDKPLIVYGKKTTGSGEAV